MATKFLSKKALAVIDKYRNFSVGSAVCSIPYYNNRRRGARLRLRAQIGKGNPENILEEVENLARKEKINLNTIDSVSLKKFLVDRNIGIDCSGLVYHILEPKKLSFPFTTGFMGRLRAKIRPVENSGVKSFAHESNSKEISINDAEPGDIITMLGTNKSGENNHILIIHQVDYRDSIPTTLHYIHAIAWPMDGEYGHGVRQGVVEIIDSRLPLIQQKWIEAGKTDEENYTYTRAQESITTLRRPLFL